MKSVVTSPTLCHSLCSVKKHIIVSRQDKCWFCRSSRHQSSYLVYLILLASIYSLWIRRRPQPELRITEVSVSINVVQALPDNLLFCQETLICNQEVQLALENDRVHITHTLTWRQSPVVCRHGSHPHIFCALLFIKPCRSLQLSDYKRT